MNQFFSAGCKRSAVSMCELHWDFPPVDNGARSQAIQSEKRGVQRHSLPEGN